MCWVGLALPKKKKRQNHAHRLRHQKLHLTQKKLASESHAGTSSFFQILTRFLHGEVASKSLKTRSGGKKFILCESRPGVFRIHLMYFS
jgi:hypothetical protein